jgi:hypothetical protein
MTHECHCDSGYTELRPGMFLAPYSLAAAAKAAIVEHLLLPE